MPLVHPAFGVDTRIRVEELPEENGRSTARTIARMAEFARDDASDPLVRGIARSLAGGSPREYVDRVHHWVRHNVRFVQDVELAAPLGGILGERPVAEVLIRPRELVRMPQPMGDCDDFSMLTLALLIAGGIPASFSTIAANPHAPRDFSHVYVVAHLAEVDVPVDASHGAAAGWEAENVFNHRALWGVGLSGMGCGCDVGYVEGLGLVQTAAPAGGINWGSILQSAITGGTQIAQTVLQKPVYQSGPTGTTVYSGQSPTVAPPGSVVGAQLLPGIDNSTLLLGGLAALVAIAFVSRK